MKKKIISIIAIISILVLINSVNHLMPLNASAATFFLDNFDNISPSYWVQQQGSWTQASGKYIVAAGIVENVISTVNTPSLANYTVETKLTFSNNGFRAGIVFRYIDINPYYAFEISDEYDCIQFTRYLPENTGYGTSDAFWSLSHGYVVPTNFQFNAGTIKTGVEYTLRVTVSDDFFTGSLISQDVNQTLTWTDSAYQNGKVGLRARAANVAFDYFIIEDAVVSPTSNLVGYWKFDEGSGASAYDSSRNGNTGTLIDDPLWVEGVSGKALQFNGQKGYVLIPDSKSLRVQSFTLSAWIYMPVRPYQAGHPPNPHVCIINKLHYAGTSAISGYKLDFENPTSTDDTLVIAIGDGIAQRFLVQYNSINALTLNQWHLVTGTYDGSTAKLYIDGQLKAVNSVQYSIRHDDTPLCITREVTQQYYDGINGKIDEVMIYDIALTSSEVQNLYNNLQPSPSPSSTPPLTPVPTANPTSNPASNPTSTSTQRPANNPTATPKPSPTANPSPTVPEFSQIIIIGFIIACTMFLILKNKKTN
ncbi:MAG: hypothetical protein NWE96_02525 [Candidatus Bathyarchaeota archaeon]|nr:hypothetical protein [Candidatus Bathyarchaeota archaeon]